MSEVKVDDQTIIHHCDDVSPLYQGVGRANAKSGLEVELAFFDPSSKHLDAMNLDQNTALMQRAVKALPEQDWVHNEPTSELLEVATIAAPFDQMHSVLKDANDKIKILCDTAESIGLKRSYFQELPDKTADDLLTRIVGVDRYQIMYAPYRADMKKCVQYFAVCKSNQVSVSPYDANHMLENVRRLYILAPFLFLLTDNSVGFNEGQPFNNHIGMSLRHNGLLEGRGGVLPYVFTSKTGDEYVTHHINHVMNNPLFMYYGLDGALNRVPSGDWSVTFNSLRERGLNTTTNYNLGQSVLWPDIKIAALRDVQGKTFAHRYEARMFGVGMHQHQSAHILTSALAFDDVFSNDVDALLQRYGFDTQKHEECHEQVLNSYKAAREHSGKFFDVPYGTGTMSDFAKDFSKLVEQMADRNNCTDEVQPILTICRTGYTDGKVNRLLCPTLEDVMALQKTYGATIMQNSNHCAYDVFREKLHIK